MEPKTGLEDTLVDKDRRFLVDEVGSVHGITMDKPVKLTPMDERRRQLELSSRSGHVPNQKHQLSNADFIVHSSGAWVRTTERDVSRKTHNKSCRRRLAKGK